MLFQCEIPEVGVLNEDKNFDFIKKIIPCFDTDEKLKIINQRIYTTIWNGARHEYFSDYITTLLKIVDKNTDIIVFDMYVPNDLKSEGVLCDFFFPIGLSYGFLGCGYKFLSKEEKNSRYCFAYIGDTDWGIKIKEQIFIMNEE